MVPKEAGMLPPVLDLEVGGDQDRDRMLRDIKMLLNLLEQHYGMQPIIYTDLWRYGDYVKEHLSAYPLWIGAALFPIQWSGPHNWSFWQYCDRCRVAGISEPVDINVFYAESNKLKALVKSS
jgi:lysozyme